MKKNKLLWIVIPAAGVLIAEVVIVAVVLVSGQMKEDKYYEQLKTAQNYMADMDYDKVISTLKTLKSQLDTLYKKDDKQQTGKDDE